MGNVIPWSQIHPSIKSEDPFVAVVVVDPHRQICVSELVELEPEAIEDGAAGAAAVIAAAQAATAKVAAGYRQQRRAQPEEPLATHPLRLRLLDGGLATRRYGTVAGERRRRNGTESTKG
jgi:hypothetical protein